MTIMLQVCDTEQIVDLCGF